VISHILLRCEETGMTLAFAEAGRLARADLAI
jgi:hypothetical protein